MPLEIPRCRCYNANSHLPWPAPEDLDLYSDEYMLNGVMNRPVDRLLANDDRLASEYLCLSSEFSCCELASSLFATVSANSGIWDITHGSAVSGVLSDYDGPASSTLVPVFPPMGDGAGNEVLSGVFVDHPSMSEDDNAVPSTKALYNSVMGAVNPENVSSDSPAHTVGGLLKWAGDNHVANAVIGGAVVTGCGDSGTGTSSVTWPPSPPNTATFCAGTTGGTLYFKSMLVAAKGSSASLAAEAVRIWSSSRNVVLGVDGDQLASSQAFGVLDTLGCYISDPVMFDSSSSLATPRRHCAMVRKIPGRITSPRQLTLRHDDTYSPASTYKWWKLTHGSVEVGGTAYSAGDYICGDMTTLAGVVLLAAYNRMIKTNTPPPPALSCCTAGIGAMKINPTNTCECPFEVSPKTGCP